MNDDKKKTEIDISDFADSLYDVMNLYQSACAKTIGEIIRATRIAIFLDERILFDCIQYQLLVECFANFDCAYLLLDGLQQLGDSDH